MMCRAQPGIWAHFDYEKMAEDVRRERDMLWAIYKRRKALGPQNGESLAEWEYGNRRYYDQYLEQRAKTKELERRAAKRRIEEGREYAA